LEENRCLRTAAGYRSALPVDVAEWRILDFAQPLDICAGLLKAPTALDR
jgi:hypothetical protein